MRISVRQRAGEGERYAAGTFDSQIGKQVPLTVEGQVADRATLVSAVVAEDGSEASLTYDIPDGTLPVAVVRAGAIGHFSMGAFANVLRPGDLPVRRAGPHFDVSLPTARAE